MSPRCNTPLCLPGAVIPMQRVVFRKRARARALNARVGGKAGSRTLTQRRGSATGNTIGKPNGETKRETTEKKKTLDCAPRCFTKHFIEMTERSFHRGFPLPVVFRYCGPRCTTPFLGRSPRANRWKNDDLGLVPIFKKTYFTKICDFPFCPSIYIQTVF